MRFSCSIPEDMQPSSGPRRNSRRSQADHHSAGLSRIDTVRHPKSEADQLFEADAMRQNYTPTHPRLVVSPENSRARLMAFLKGARRELLIYDAQVSDNAIQKVLAERAEAGVRIRIIGRLEKQNGDI